MSIYMSLDSMCAMLVNQIVSFFIPPKNPQEIPMFMLVGLCVALCLECVPVPVHMEERTTTTTTTTTTNVVEIFYSTCEIM